MFLPCANLTTSVITETATNVGQGDNNDRGRLSAGLNVPLYG